MLKYFWHESNKIEKELINAQAVKKIRIASAFFNSYGLEVLKRVVSHHSISPEKLEIFLSPEFTTDKPSKILSELCQLSNHVHIVTKLKFHPKVYLFECADSTKVIFGSANFTGGGILKNIEFNQIKDLDSTELFSFNNFFDYCRNNSEIVTPEIIKYYQDNEAELGELKALEKKIRKKLFDFVQKDDPFDEDEYDLDSHYFKYEDYEILFPRNQKLNDNTIKSRRKNLRDKILQIHSKIYKDIKKLGVNCHWNKNHITSTIDPMPYNEFRVAWLGVRYGKTEDEVKELNYGVIDKDEEFRYQKHACLQYCITSEGFEVNLFHAVRHDAVDRDYFKKQLTVDKTLKNRVIKEIEKLKGNGLVWYINEESSGKLINQFSFKIDTEEASDFINFFKEHDDDGCYSLLSYYVEPDNIEIKDVDSISRLVLQKVKLMLPLYNLIAYRLNF